MKIRHAVLKDLPGIYTLLKECQLPTDDVIAHLKNFLVFEHNRKLFGCVGLNLYKKCCLLRSLAVTSVERSKGYGFKLVNEALHLASRKSSKTVYLLTIDRADFFRRIGFERIKRDKVDIDIQKSHQFTSVCCQSAVCMAKSI